MDSVGSVILKPYTPNSYGSRVLEKETSSTPPKFNSSPPEKSWLEDDPFLLGEGKFFRGYVKIWECNNLLKSLHPGILPWNLKIIVWKMIFLFNWVIFRFQPLIFQGVCLISKCQTVRYLKPSTKKFQESKGKIHSFPTLEIRWNLSIVLEY